jgi:hypothetical protein
MPRIEIDPAFKPRGPSKLTIIAIGRTIKIARFSSAGLSAPVTSGFLMRLCFKSSRKS